MTKMGYREFHVLLFLKLSCIFLFDSIRILVFQMDSFSSYLDIHFPLQA